MRYGSRRIKHGGEVIPVGGEHPHGVVTDVEITKAGKVTYTVAPATPADYARFDKKRADAPVDVLQSDHTNYGHRGIETYAGGVYPGDATRPLTQAAKASGTPSAMWP